MKIHSSFFLVALIGICACTSDPEPLEIGVPNNQAYIARGRELVRGLAACGQCHGAEADPQSPLIGGRVFNDRYGDVTAANLTPDKETGLGDWSANEILQAIRSSIGKDGRLLSEPMHEGYEWMSDKDALSIVAYLKALPPVKNEIEKRHVGWFERNTVGFFESREKQSGYVPSIDPKLKLEYGKYLAENVARSQQCFAPWEEDSGGFFDAITGEEKAPASKHPFKDWSIDEIVYYLQTGDAPSDKAEAAYVDPNSCPTKFYRNASEEDLTAIATYLKAK